MTSLKRGAIATIYAVFTIASVGASVSARTAGDRLTDVAVAIFFGLGGSLYVARGSLDRGLRFRPSPALRVGGPRPVLDRLAFRASPRYLLYLAGSGVLFLTCAGVGFFAMEDVEGAVVGVLSLGLCAGIASTFTLLLREPLIVFERDRLRWRMPYRGWRDAEYDRLAGGRIAAGPAGRVCVLLLLDLDGEIARAEPARRREIVRTVASYGGPIVLPVAVAPDAEQLLALVAQYATFPTTEANAPPVGELPA